MEKWKPIVGYENYYLVSNLGRIKSIIDNHNNVRKTEKILKTNNNNSGYQYVSLYGDKHRKGVHFLVHRIVAEAFVDGYENGMEVNHKDGNKGNNRADNLEWVSHIDNHIHRVYTVKHYAKKLSPKKIECVETGEKFMSAALAAKTKNINRSLLCRSARTATRAGGFHWRYI